MCGTSVPSPVSIGRKRSDWRSRSPGKRATVSRRDLPPSSRLHDDSSCFDRLRNSLGCRAEVSSADSGALSSKQGGTRMDPSLDSPDETGSYFFRAADRRRECSADDVASCASTRWQGLARTVKCWQARGELGASAASAYSAIQFVQYMDTCIPTRSDVIIAVSSWFRPVRARLGQFAAGRAQTEHALRADLLACREIHCLGIRNRAELNFCCLQHFAGDSWPEAPWRLDMLELLMLRSRALSSGLQAPLCEFLDHLYCTLRFATSALLLPPPETRPAASTARAVRCQARIIRHPHGRQLLAGIGRRRRPAHKEGLCRDGAWLNTRRCTEYHCALPAETFDSKFDSKVLI